MRLRIRPVLTLFALAVGIRLAPAIVRSVRDAVQKQVVANAVPDAVTRRVGFVVDSNSWTEFELPSNVNRIRIVTAAAIERDAAFNTFSFQQQVDWSYSLNYEFLTADRQSLQSGEHNFCSRCNFYRRGETTTTEDSSTTHSTRVSGSTYSASKDTTNSTDTLFSPTVFRTPDLIPAASRQMQLTTQTLPESPRRVRLKVKQCDPDIRDVVVRVFFRVERTDHELNDLWNRMSAVDRELLTRNSVYPHQLLGKDERRELLRNYWNPLAPAGIEGRDYLRRQFLTLNEPPGTPVIIEPVQPRLSQHESFAVHVPREPGIVRIQCAAPLEYDFPVRFTSRWFGKGNERSNTDVIFTREQLSFEQTVNDGTLQFEVPVGLRIQSFWRPAGATTDVEIELSATASVVSQYKLTAQGSGATFEVVHVNSNAAPLKISVRRIGEIVGLRSAPAPLSWTTFDAAGQQIETGVIQIDAAYQQDFSVGENPQPVSDQQHSFFSLLPNVRQIKFHATDCELLLSTFSRPPDLRPVTRIPEDYSAFENAQSTKRAWFRLRANNHTELENADEICLVKTHWNAPDDEPDILAGPHHSVEYRPGENWIGRYILSPRDAQKSPFQMRSAAVVYSQITPNKTERVEFISETGAWSVSPTLLIIRPESLAESSSIVSVIIDEQLIATESIFGRIAAIPLPPIDASQLARQTLRVETTDRAVVVVNRIRPGSRPTMLRQIANRFRVTNGRAALEFPFEKTTAGDELLTLRIYRGENNTARTRIIAGISGSQHRPTTRNAWTHPAREFDIAPASEPSHVLIGTEKETIDGGQVFFLKAGRDLPPGNYTIHVSCEDSSPKYLTMKRLLPGLPKEARTWFETTPDADAVNR